jgi:hypothetical protein
MFAFHGLIDPRDFVAIPLRQFFCERVPEEPGVLFLDMHHELSDESRGIVGLG